MIATQTNRENSESASLDAASDSKYFVFRSGDRWFAIPAVVVREITASPELVRIPDCHDSLAGICHLRAEFIPAISMNGILGIDPGDDEEVENTLLVISGQVTWALQIAEAGSIETLEVLRDAELTENAPAGSVELGTAMLDDKILRVLDHSGVYQRAHQLVANSWTASANPLQPTHGDKANANYGVNDETK